LLAGEWAKERTQRHVLQPHLPDGGPQLSPGSEYRGAGNAAL
jgi:hypothetical protein